jgi:hypothetical protein
MIGSLSVIVGASEGQLMGNWSWTVLLLIPLAIGVGLVTALCLGPLGEPARVRSSARGVSRYLDEHTNDEREAH